MYFLRFMYWRVLQETARFRFLNVYTIQHTQLNMRETTQEAGKMFPIDQFLDFE